MDDRSSGLADVFNTILNMESAQKAYHCKARTGCVTCKQRRVKCDEAKPTCFACARIGRECGGYADPTSIKRMRPYSGCRGFRNSFVTGRAPAPPKSVSLFPSSASDPEIRAYEFFMRCTIPVWLCYDPIEGWTGMLFCMQQSQPALRQACVALGSMHASLSSNKDEIQKTAYGLVAVQQYTSAISDLRIAISRQTIPSMSVIMACVLMAVYESLQGRRDDMLIHLRNGLNIMSQSPVLAQTLAEQHVVDVLVHLGYSHALYGRPRLDSSPEVQLLLDQTAGLDSAAELHMVTDQRDLRNRMRILSHQVLGYVHFIDKGAYDTDFDAFCSQATLLHKLQIWLQDFSSLQSQEAIRTTGSDRGRTHILLARYELAYIFVKAYAVGKTVAPQVAYDQYASNFVRIVDSLETIFGSSSQEPAYQQNDPEVFSIDLGVVQVLFTTALACRHPAIRRRATSLLRRVPRREGVWNAETMMKITSIICDYEESRSTPNEDVGKAFGIAESDRVQQVSDIYKISEGVPGSGSWLLNSSQVPTLEPVVRPAYDRDCLAASKLYSDVVVLKARHDDMYPGHRYIQFYV